MDRKVWSGEPAHELSTEAWTDSIRMACRWITDVAQIRTRELGLESRYTWITQYADWTGAFRGEYNAAQRKWDVFCPIWHGGQGVTALIMAAEALGDNALLGTAKLGADFILRNQNRHQGDEDFGCLLTFEGSQELISVSAMMECLDGLFRLSHATGDSRYAEAAVDTLRWVQRKQFLPDEGLFVDEYDLQKRERRVAPWLARVGCRAKGRPLLEDGVFITGWRLTGDETFKDVAVSVADRLLRDEDPPGNWVGYPPSFRATGVIHPRMAYWWGLPMLMVHEATGDERYLRCAERCAVWYAKAMRRDGGLFRENGPDFNTSSFGHATSGVAGAAILWTELAARYGQAQWQPCILKALRFCYDVQFRDASDPNLRGAVLEKVLAPAGSDAPPWYLRDIGTFFYVQAACRALKACPEAIVDHGKP